ncbi:MAG: hypothetical protein HY906_06520 [Deltaproteobacteria bacterium]|nr:hypothetical protein [Deltaproteobacteria bacterium]
MATAKISATLGSATLAAIRSRVGKGGLSSWLELAAREKLERDQRVARVRAYLAELAAADPIPAAARARAHRLVRDLLGR